MAASKLIDSTAGAATQVCAALPTPLGALDELLARAEGGLLALSGDGRELGLVAEHVARRAQLAGRSCFFADGRTSDEPWRDLVAMLGVDPSLGAHDCARAILRSANGRVVVVLEDKPGAWASAMGHGLSIAAEEARGAAVVVLTPRRVEGMKRVALAGMTHADDLARYYAALVEAAQGEVGSFASLGDLNDWWHAATSWDDSDSYQPVDAASAAGRKARTPDAWTSMRAAEQWVAAGEPSRALLDAGAALEHAPDAAARADMWARFDACLGGILDDDELVRHAEIALDHGDLEQARRLAGRATGRESFPLALMVGRVARARGDVAAAKSALEDALGRADDSASRAQAEIELAELALVAGRQDDARAHAQQCSDLATSAELRLAARNVLGKVLLALGSWSEAAAHFSADEREASAAARPSDALRARLNRAIAVMSAGRKLEARAQLEAVLETGERLGDDRAMAFALANLATLAAVGHQYAEALELIERAIAAMRTMGDAFKLARQILNLAELRLRIGMVREAEQALAFGRQACGPALGDTLVTLMSLVAAKVQLELGNTLQAEAYVEEAIAAADRSEDGAKLGESLRLAARIALEDGHLQKARQHLSRAATAPAGPGAEIQLTLLRALCARAAGEPFAGPATEAVELARASDDLELGRQAHELHCQAALVEGDGAAARSSLEQATTLRERMMASLPSAIRVRYLARRDLQQLAKLSAEVEAATSEQGAHREPARKRRRNTDAPSSRSLVGESRAIGALRAAIAKVAPSEATVLVGGESGTGKELVADAIHQASGRSAGPLVKVHCAALVESLLLSELFGHERGAFTGAQERRRGRFEQAHGGTIFLDEIGDISPKTQVALLRVLQERCFERVGGTEPVRVDVRVVCATHRDLRTMVAEGTFREDLYYRLCGFTLQVPALRERRSDLPLLAEALLERIGKEQGSPPKRLSREAVEALTRHRWPGNVRELQNALRAAALFASGPVVGLADVTDNVASLAYLGGAAEEPAPTSFVRGFGVSPSDTVYAEIKGGTSLPELKRALERACIERALEESDGNITQAAKLLGMKRPRVSQLVNQFAREQEVAS